ncbi:TPA: DUF5011 domain-containing protein [Clostridioides difficile]|uniref:immunoglobulin-like domain-containing protein n=2 Tax=Clostridioides difficile TaxID=1496 RepID=UPI00016C6799|nr:immunoglobulin-like domain-containing protein [Clostridioides difficile]EGT3944934.1 DUF5011 domain-containing protein [Clostridioides difficile]MBG0198859.1 DUF5011 domain-containing protein [Clostridioides difficile]MCA0574557.1 DUF5011 domain-containing protein [Clostridioides difficile]SJT18460.1 Lectin C-type domain [Clostridioides difficile]VHT35455.1 neutral protease A, bacillolysin [Clostridioides difficile]
MNNKKIISIFLSASILSSNLPYNVLADMKNSNNQIIYNENNSINKETQNEGKEKSSESFSLDMGKYVDTNGILTFPEAKGIVDNPTYLRFDFNRNVYENVTITYSLNSVENTLIGKNIKIPIRTQNELNEVLKTLRIDTKNNKKLGFDIILGGLPIYKSVEGVPSRLYKAERAVDGNNDSFYGAINKNNSTFTILFEDKTYIENVLIKANKKFIIKGLKNGSWTKIGEGTPEVEKNESKKTVSVTAGEYEGIRIEQAHSGVDSCTISELEFNEESNREKINYNRSEYSLNLGEKSINNDGSISFTEASAKGDNAKLLINFKNSSNKNKISYTQNGKYNEKEGDSEITVSNESELNEIIRSLKIYHDNKVENNVKITLLPDNFSFMEDVPKGVLVQGNSLDDKYTAENVFSGSSGYFISGSDNQLVLKNTKELYINGAYFLNGNSIIIVKGLKNGTWTDIGKHSSNEAEMVNLAPGYYDEIKFVSSSTLDMRNLYLRYSNINEDVKLEIFKDESPELKVGANVDILQNNKFDVMAGVTASDFIDGDLTNKINVEITNPNGEKVSELDTSILGKWTIKYTVKDSGDNTTVYLRTLKVVKDFNVSIDLGKELVTSKYVKFPDAKINSVDDQQKIDGLKMYFPEFFDKDSFKIHYTLNGVEKESTDQRIEINKEFSLNEAEELVKSIKIEHKNNTEFKFTVKLGKNEVDDIVYNYENNHYYKFISAPGITWKDAKVDAEKQELLGVRGYLATITSAYEQEVIHNLTANCIWLGGTDEKEEGKWEWVTKEPFIYTNWYPGRPDNYLGQQHYIISYNDSQRLWDDDFNIASGGKIDGYIVEFGLDEKLPYPNTLDKFKYEDTATIKPIECKQDIVLNAFFEKNKNKVMLDWNNIKDIDHYKILLKEKEEDFKIIKEQKDTYFEEDKKDINKPTAPTYELFNSGIKQGINFNSEDISSVYEYYIEGISEYGDITHISNKEKVEIKSGFKGFSYEVSNSSVPSISLGDVVNSTDGFISAKELASKLYVHIVSVDKAGNKSEVVTLPIAGIFEDLPPVLNVGGNTSIEQGKVFDIMKGINAIDDYDGDLTKDINVVIKNPDNKIVDEFDTNILGKWSIEYSVKDSKNQESKIIKEIIVKENLDYLNIKLGEPDKKRFIATFPNASITNNSDELINGMKLYISEGFNSSMTIKYLDKGIEKHSKERQIILNENYTTEEAEELIKSIKIEHDNSTSFIFNVRLQNNSVDDIIYNPQNGNYYQFIEDKRITWKNAKERAEKMEYRGLKGHLATIKSKYELDLFNCLTTKTVWLGATDEEEEGKWKWVTGEPVKFTNWCVGEPNNLGGTEDYMSSIKNSGGLWNDTVNSPDPVWTDIEGFVVEFENMDNGSSDGVYRYEDSVKIDNMVSKQDIVLNLENKDDNITLNWNDYKNADYYKVLRKEKDSFEIVKDNLRENILSGYLAEDKVPPKMEYSLILNKERTAKMEFFTEDIGSDYEYKVESYDEDDYQTAYSNIVKTTAISGFKGYYYEVDENPNTEINGEVNNTDGKFEFKNVTDNTYLHIYAIDNKGNKSETKHIKLSDDTYNNKPIITVPGRNRVINLGENFDKLEGVSAYDFEDGNLTDKINIEGEIDNTKKGVYEVKYTVVDSKGLESEETVKVHVIGDMKIDITELNNNLEVNWTPVKNAVKYVLYRTNENGFSFEEKGTFNDTQFIDNTATDTSSPAITYLGEINEDSIKTRKVVSLSKEILRKLNKDIDSSDNIKLKVISKDLGTTYRYFVEALDKDNNVVNSSEIRNGKVTSGLAGFSYAIDEKENTEVKNFVNIKNAEDIDIKNNKSKFLHIKAIDKNGNVSKTIHHLITGKYDTNYIPVIKGLTSKRVKEGESFNPLAGVTAYDVEDGDITNKIQIIGSVDTNKNGKYQLIYKVEDSQGNIREVKRNILVHGDMEIKVTPNKEDNNVDISWDKNVLGDDVFYEVRKWNSMEGYYTTIGYTEDLSFTDTDTKDIFGPKINGITEIKEEENNIDEENYEEEENIDEENFLEYNDLENKNNVDENIDKNMDVLEGNNLNSNKFLRKDINDNTYLKLNIDAVDRGVSETYQVRTRLKEDNTVIRDMTDEEGRDWDVGTDFGGEVEYFKWKLSNKREDNLDTGTIKTSVSKDTIEFNTEDYKYIHFIPYDTYGNAGQLVHYELGEINNEENELIPPTIEGVKNRVIMIDSKFNVLEGIKAYDYAGEDLTGYIKINGFVDANKTGEYTLNYSVMDFKGQLTEETCNIVVADYNENIPNEKPNKIDNSPIVVNYADEVYIKVGNKYDVMSGIKVTDEEDGDLTSKVTYTTNLDTNKVGDYIVNYSIRDSGDNRVRWNRVVHVIPNNIDCPETGEPSPDWEGNGAFPQIYAYPTYIAVGSEFNPYDSIIVYDEEDGYITNKLKFSGYVNTLKPGIYYLTYKVTDSDGNTSYCGRAVYVYEGNWGNPDGEKPNPDPDWGENDNEDEDNDHIPPKPNQPDQDEEGLPPSNLPNIDKDQDGDGQKDIYIDKNGNVVKPDGSIETPGGIIVRPSEDGKVPSIDGEGNIVVPPNSIIIKSDGSIEIPKNGAIIRPNGNIEIQQQYKQDDDENNKYIYRDDPDNEERNGTNNNSEGYNNNESNDENNPSTGDKGIFIFLSLIIVSLVGLFFNRKKK